LTASDRRLRQLRATTNGNDLSGADDGAQSGVPVGRQIDEVLRAHTNLDARARRKRILDMMDHVRCPRSSVSSPPTRTGSRAASASAS